MNLMPCMQSPKFLSMSIKPVTRTCCCRGVLVDMSLKGTSIETDTEDIGNCYGANVTPAQILGGQVAAPREAVLLYNTIKELMEKAKSDGLV